MNRSIPQVVSRYCLLAAVLVVFYGASPHGLVASLQPSARAAAVFVVTQPTESGPGSLRQAITDANNNPGVDTITFNLGAARTITTSALPTVTDPVVIDGTTEPGYSGVPLIELRCSDSNGIHVTAGGTVIQGLVINHCGVGIYLLGGGNNVIRGNYIGTDITGAVAAGNGSSGIQVENSSNNTIGGTQVWERNVVSGNRGIGVNIFRGTGNRVLGNYVGTDARGASGLGNSFQGIALTETTNAVVGGTSPEARNVVSGNGSTGISISGSTLSNGTASGNQVLGNYIGTNVAGTAAIGNRGGGVFILTASNNVIGGIQQGAGNLISGNGEGVRITGLGPGNRLEGNYIGTDRTGTLALGNPGGGVVIINSAGQQIGGAATGARNIISSNGSRGIWIFGSTGIIVQGNYIGVGADGSLGLGNASYGIYLNNASGGNFIGGTTASAGNLIAFNGRAGAYDAKDGGSMFPIGGNLISSNRIHSNAGLGIDLFLEGVTPNDAGDADNVQNFPVLTSAVRLAGGINVRGRLDTKANGTFSVQFFSSDACDPSGNGEGRSYLGATTLVTDGGGSASIDVMLTAGVGPGSFMTATATSASNATSEFSQCLLVAERTDSAPVLLTEDNSESAIALDSVTLLRDPLPLFTSHNFGQDGRTRVSLFAVNLELNPGEDATAVTAQAEDSQGAVYPMLVEYVGKTPGYPWLTQVVTKLPDGLGAGEVRLSIKLRGITSNKVRLRIAGT